MKQTKKEMYKPKKHNLHDFVSGGLFGCVLGILIYKSLKLEPIWILLLVFMFGSIIIFVYPKLFKELDWDV